MKSVLCGLLGLLSASIVVACASTQASPAPHSDAGSDATPTGPEVSSDASAADQEVPDAGRPDVQLASRLAVACAQEPCYVAVSGTGSEHVCGLVDDGTVRCWGRDSRVRTAQSDAGETQADGALGRGHSVSVLEGATPAEVVGLHDVTQLSVGRNLGTCALTSDGSVYCWGRNEFGQLGRPSSEQQLPTPTLVPGLPPMSRVALGATTGCAVASADGALYCWGTQITRVGITLGTETRFSPRLMTAFRSPVHDLVIGSTSPFAVGDQTIPYQDTILALLDDGILAALGELPAGESSNDSLYLPTPIELSGVLRIGAFGYLAANGVLSRWVPDARALYVAGASSVVDLAIAPGRARAIAVPMTTFVEQAGLLLANGTLFRWGLNTAGALGYSPDDLDVANEPMEMTHVAGNRVVSFATTTAGTCVSSVDGSVKCWGTNQNGELGRGTIDYVHHPEAEVIR